MMSKRKAMRSMTKILVRDSGQFRLLVGVTIIGVLSFINQVSPDKFQSRFEYLSTAIGTVLLISQPNPSVSNEEASHILLPQNDRKVLSRQSFPVGDANRRRVVIVTAASHDVSHFVKNLRCFVRQTTKKDIVLFSLDSNMTKFAKREGIQRIDWHSIKKNHSFASIEKKLSNDSNPHLFGSQSFSSISLSKLDIVLQILRTGLDVIFTDVDIVWCKDIHKQFKQLLNKHPTFDIFMQSNTKSEGKLAQLNTGFYYVKSTPHVLRLFDGLIKASDKWNSRSGDDQTLFWGYACSGGNNKGNGNGVTNMNEGKNGSNPQFLCQWNNGSVSIMFLPIKEFPNGASDPEGRSLVHIPKGYYRKVCKNKQLSIWHVNYCKGDMKERRLREQNVWISHDNGTCDSI